MTRSHLYLRAKTSCREELLSALERLEVLTAARKQPGFVAAEVQVEYDDPERVLL